MSFSKMFTPAKKAALAEAYEKGLRKYSLPEEKAAIAQLAAELDLSTKQVKVGYNIIIFLLCIKVS